MAQATTDGTGDPGPADASRLIGPGSEEIESPDDNGHDGHRREGGSGHSIQGRSPPRHPHRDAAIDGWFGW